MSGYETSFAGGEEEVAKSPQFQHDAHDAEVAEGASESELDSDSDETKKIAEEPAGGMVGPEGFSTDTPAPAP